jgi:hypothetical protein
MSLVMTTAAETVQLQAQQTLLVKQREELERQRAELRALEELRRFQRNYERMMQGVFGNLADEGITLEGMVVSFDRAHEINFEAGRFGLKGRSPGEVLEKVKALLCRLFRELRDVAHIAEFQKGLGLAGREPIDYLELVVEAHTDSRFWAEQIEEWPGEILDNWHLSGLRAAQVARFLSQGFEGSGGCDCTLPNYPLLAHCSLNPPSLNPHVVNIHASGRSEFRPRESAIDAQENRRVQFHLSIRIDQVLRDMKDANRPR